MSDEPDLEARVTLAIATWSDEDEDAFDAAFAALPHTGDAGLALGQRLVASGDPMERALGARILGAVINPDREHVSGVIGLLAPLIESEHDPLVLACAIRALSHTEDRDRAVASSRHAVHADAGVRLAVAQALSSGYNGEIEPEDYLPALLALSSDADDDVRDWACFGLGRIVDVDTPELRSALAARLDDPHEDTRSEAIVGLASRHDPRALPPLIAMLEAGSSLTLLVEAAAWIGDASLVPHLLDFASDDEVEAALDRCDPERRERRATRNSELVAALATHGIAAEIELSAFEDEVSWERADGRWSADVERVLARPDVNGDIEAAAAHLAAP